MSRKSPVAAITIATMTPLDRLMPALLWLGDALLVVEDELEGEELPDAGELVVGVTVGELELELMVVELLNDDGGLEDDEGVVVVRELPRDGLLVATLEPAAVGRDCDAEGWLGTGEVTVAPVDELPGLAEFDPGGVAVAPPAVESAALPPSLVKPPSPPTIDT